MAVHVVSVRKVPWRGCYLPVTVVSSRSSSGVLFCLQFRRFRSVPARGFLPFILASVRGCRPLPSPLGIPCRRRYAPNVTTAKAMPAIFARRRAMGYAVMTDQMTPIIVSALQDFDLGDFQTPENKRQRQAFAVFVAGALDGFGDLRADLSRSLPWPHGR